jgi:hypothetical protein
VPILKEPTQFFASQSVPAGTTVTGPIIDLREKYGVLIQGKVTNGATGPSTPPEMVVEISTDNFAADTKEYIKLIADLANNAVTNLPVRLPPEVMFARVKGTAGTGQASTIEAMGHTVKSLG